MKLAIITDIHGNEPALRAVLEELDTRGDIEEIWCLGDMIAMGPDSNEVLEILFARQDVHMITGNHASHPLVQGMRKAINIRDTTNGSRIVYFGHSQTHSNCRLKK
jgi:predicted phosphodiesterase